jgi:hypothetical protein
MASRVDWSSSTISKEDTVRTWSPSGRVHLRTTTPVLTGTTRGIPNKAVYEYSNICPDICPEHPHLGVWSPLGEVAIAQLCQKDRKADGHIAHVCSA